MMLKKRAPLRLRNRLTLPVGTIKYLEEARDEFRFEWTQKRLELAKVLDCEGLDEETPQAVWDEIDDINHCGTCLVNYVVGTVEPTLLSYVSALELCLGMDPSGWVETHDVKFVAPQTANIVPFPAGFD